MLDRAKEHHFAFPAINCTSSETINAAIKGIRRRRQRRHHPVLNGRSRIRFGPGIKEMVTGAVALAEFAPT